MKNSKVVSQFRSLLMLNHGHTGVVYRVNEYICPGYNHFQHRTSCSCPHCWPMRNPQHRAAFLIKGEVRPYHMDDSGKPDSHLYSHSYIVTPSQNTVFRAANIVRKAILCLQTPDECSAWTIFVHLFQFLQKLSMFHITLNRGIWSSSGTPATRPG